MTIRYHNTLLSMLVVAAGCGMFSAPAEAFGPIDFLRKVNLSEDQVAGKWTKSKKGEYISHRSGPAVLRLPAPREGDYTLRVTCTRLRGDGPIGVFLVRGDDAFTFLIGDGNSVTGEGFALADGKSTGQNALKSTSEKVQISNKTPIKIVIRVTSDSIEAKVNGTKVAIHKAGEGELGVNEAHNIEGGHLGLIAHNAKCRFEEAQFTPIRKPAAREVRQGRTPKNDDDDGGDAADPFVKGAVWSGNYSDSLAGTASCSMRIENRQGDRVTALLRFGHDRAARFIFTIRKGRIRVISLSDHSRFGNRQFSNVGVDSNASQFGIMCNFLLNSDRRKNQIVTAKFIMSKE